MKTLREANIGKGTRVLVRCDFNCPIDENGNVLETYRIEKTLPTINYLLKKEARVILMSHLDDPGGKVVENLRLTPIADALFSYLDLSITRASTEAKREDEGKLYRRQTSSTTRASTEAKREDEGKLYRRQTSSTLKAPDCVGKNIEQMVKEMQEGEILLLENLRFHKEEEINDKTFSQKLASLGEIYINDAFGVCHRAHASIVGVPKFLPSFAGFLLESEIKNLSKVLENPERPLAAIFGGAKIETKLPTIQKFLDVADFILVGGKIAKEIDFSHPKLYNASDFNQGLDIGDKTIKEFKEIISRAKTIIWNGPMGFFEKPEFEKGTKKIAQAIAENNGFKIAGGGETLLAIIKYGLEKNFDFLSTGGGAMLDFLAGKKLPGIEALNN
jgi:phosphoglycerate kinase